MTARTGRGGPSLTVIYWRDIPAQVKAQSGRTRVSAPLPARFMVAVDAAATKAGKTGWDDYIGEWREESRPCDGGLQEELDKETARIAETYPANLIKTFVRNGGWAESPSASEFPASEFPASESP